MNAVIEGEVVTSQDLELKSDVNALDQMDPESREVAVTGILQQSRDWLVRAQTATDPAREVSEFKAYIATVAETSKQLKLSKEIQRDAQVMVRRAERSLGVAIREGQSAGTISGRGTQPRRGNQYKRGEDVNDISSVASPSDYVSSKTELSNPHGTGIYAVTDGVTEAEFESALGQARSDGNVTRANVIRNIKEAKGTAPASEPTRKGDPKRASNQVETFRRIINSLEGTQIIFEDFARAGLDPAITDGEAKEIIDGLEGFVRAIGRVKKSLNGN